LKNIVLPVFFNIFWYSVQLKFFLIKLPYSCSTKIKYYQLLSITIKYYQLLSIIINYYQVLFIIIPYVKLTLFICCTKG